jgi:putative endonuclease
VAGDPRQRLGKSGEDLACAELERRGYAILARRYRTRYGEIDIVARDAGVIVFAEVKARVTDRFGRPAEAVTRQKQRRIARMAVDFLARHRLQDGPCRFDVVTVEWSGERPRVEIYRNAFAIS